MEYYPTLFLGVVLATSFTLYNKLVLAFVHCTSPTLNKITVLSTIDKRLLLPYSILSHPHCEDVLLFLPSFI